MIKLPQTWGQIWQGPSLRTADSPIFSDRRTRSPDLLSQVGALFCLFNCVAPARIERATPALGEQASAIVSKAHDLVVYRSTLQRRPNFGTHLARALASVRWIGRDTDRSERAPSSDGSTRQHPA